MQAQINATIQSFPILAAALGRKYGIQVEFGGSEAFTDSNRIHLPALPENLNDEAMLTVGGYLDHEAAHCRLSDFKLLEKEKLTEVSKFVANTLEDCWIEKEFTKLYPGTAAHFAWLVKKVLAVDGIYGLDKTGVTEVLNWLLLYSRSLDHKDILQPKLDLLEPKLEQVFPGLIDQLKPVLCKVQQSRSTTDNLAITKEVMQLLSAYTPPEQKQEEQTKPADTTKKGKGGFSNSSKQGDSPRSLADVLESLVRSGESDAQSFDDRLRDSVNQETHKKNRSSFVSTATVMPALETWQYFTDAELIEARRMAAGLKQKLRLMLQGQARSQVIPSRMGRLNMRKLACLRTGDTRVFSKVTQGTDTSAAIEVLIDTSFSTTPFLEDELLVAATLMEALQIEGVATALTSFPMRVRSGCEGICVLFDYGEKFRAPRLPKIQARGSTPLAECLRSVLLRILQRPEKNKHIFLLTDAGQCDSNTLAKQSIDAVENAGVLLHTIGIKSKEIRNLIPEAIIIDDVAQDLPKALFEEVLRSLKAN